jgi:hypothetical protein
VGPLQIAPGCLSVSLGRKIEYTTPTKVIGRVCKAFVWNQFLCPLDLTVGHTTNWYDFYFCNLLIEDISFETLKGLIVKIHSDVEQGSINRKHVLNLFEHWAQRCASNFGLVAKLPHAGTFPNVVTAEEE